MNRKNDYTKDKQTDKRVVGVECLGLSRRVEKMRVLNGKIMYHNEL
jgi:hypothetical protein